MSKHLTREISRLEARLLQLARMVESSFSQAVEALLRRDVDLARSVIRQDLLIDSMEVDVEQEGLRLLALHQPVAIDLRSIVTVLKANSDLERIGDLLVNIAERTTEMTGEDFRSIRAVVRELARVVEGMIEGAMGALVNQDRETAGCVLLAYREVDSLGQTLYDEFKRLAVVRPEVTEELMRWLSGARNLERIAGHATNIAEDVIYMCEGTIVRHKRASA